MMLNKKQFDKILIIQTAFIGDVILATVLIEKLKQHYPKSKIDFLLRKGNESLLENHPLLNQTLIWNKKEGKYKTLIKTIKQIRKEHYDLVINVQRFMSSGIITAFSKAKYKVGFDKNPLSWTFDKKIKHEIKDDIHEIQRNLNLVTEFTDNQYIRPKLYPSEIQFQKVKKYQNQDYICIAPTSVWFTKQFPSEKWIKFIKKIPKDYQIFLLGSPSDDEACDLILKRSKISNIENLSGKLSLLESAALMKDAKMNYVNDSAPMHLASSMNASTTVIYCSTIPAFGFGPLSENKNIVEVQEKLDCRPCGLHGYKSCPKNHFNCAERIDTSELLKTLS